MVEVPVTQDELAGAANLSRNSVGAIVQRLRARGLVELGHRGMVVCAPAGLRAACGAPVVGFMALGPLKMFAFVRSQNFERPSELPEPSLHIFYHRRVADATDAVPKVSGYWASEMAVSRMAVAEPRQQSAHAVGADPVTHPLQGDRHYK